MTVNGVMDRFVVQPVFFISFSQNKGSGNSNQHSRHNSQKPDFENILRQRFTSKEER